MFLFSYTSTRLFFCFGDIDVWLKIRRRFFFFICRSCLQKNSLSTFFFFFELLSKMENKLYVRWCSRKLWLFCSRMICYPVLVPCLFSSSIYPMHHFLFFYKTSNVENGLPPLFAYHITAIKNFNRRTRKKSSCKSLSVTKASRRNPFFFSPLLYLSSLFCMW